MTHVHANVQSSLTTANMSANETGLSEYKFITLPVL